MINKNYILFFVSLVIVFIYYNDAVFYKTTIKETLNNKISNENILNLKNYQNNFFNDGILSFNVKKENNIFDNNNIKDDLSDKKIFNTDLKNFDILNKITSFNNNISSEKEMAINIILNKENDIEVSWLNNKIKRFNVEKINLKSKDKDFNINSLKSSILYQYMNIGEKHYLFDNEKNIYKRIELTNRYLMSVRNVETSGDNHRFSVFSPTQALGRYQINGSTSRKTLITFLRKYNLDINDIQYNEDFNIQENLNKNKIDKKNIAEYFVNKMEQKHYETYKERWNEKYKESYTKDMNTFINRFLNSLKEDIPAKEEELLTFVTKYMTIFTNKNETRIGQGVLSLITSENKMLVAKNFNQLNNYSSASEVVEKTRLFYNASKTKHVYANKVIKNFKNIINYKIINDNNLYRKNYNKD